MPGTGRPGHQGVPGTDYTHFQHTMPVRLGDDRREVVGEASSPLRFVAPRGDACWEVSRTDSLTTGFEPSGCTQQENMSFRVLWLLTQSQCSADL